MCSLDKKYFLKAVVVFFTFFINNYVYTQATKEKKISKSKSGAKHTYYGYWNPYRRKADFKNSRDFFISNPYFEVSRNAKGKIKTVVKYNSNNEKVDSWHIKILFILPTCLIISKFELTNFFNFPDFSLKKILQYNLGVILSSAFVDRIFEINSIILLISF